MKKLLKEISSCRLCAEQLQLGPRPVATAHHKSKIVIIGQAPGLKVHQSGVPWDDKSGENLRKWMGVDKEAFYKEEDFAIIPMGFCYPGRGKTGDLPPMKICAPQWHGPLFDMMKDVKLVLLIGKYAQDYYLENSYRTLTKNVKNYEDFLPRFFVLPHPSPRNNIWQAKNEWFQHQVLPALKMEVSGILNY
ncbi:uracil-DNA glycosylase family protein [Portibacter lacus]|uniref:IclR family transcriptional regulator n=1 Tax=Portibacter lacus TaxID=1099794 RepID=A0AA37WFT1_9BACT|nr:uracil-DNA glycosylase family protein [Portibacter lacus]GLR17205.1 IclR family transcriptional regulator [Portibacter lacus]